MTDVTTLFRKPSGIYLLNHSVGLMPTGLAQHLGQAVLKPWEADTENVWPQWLGLIDEFRQCLARLFNHESANFCPQPSVSSGATKILYSLPELNKRPTILIAEQAFPSLGFVFDLANRSGFKTKYIPKSENTQDSAVWERYMTDDVGLVLITHVHSNTGECLPVKTIAEAARRHGVLSMIDTAQSNGVIPIDLKDWSVDFVIGSCVKWLCGGPGAGFLWVHPDVLPRTKPIDVGWFSHQDPFEFDIHHFEYAEDAMRFWGGTPAILPYAAATFSINQMLDIGIDTIRHHNLKLTQRLIDGLPADRVFSPKDALSRSGTVVVAADADKDKLHQKLSDAGISFDHRENGFRLSPHIYNTAGDLDAAIACLTN